MKPTKQKLFIVESPTKAKTIKNYLKDFDIIATKGHIFDLKKKSSDRKYLGINLTTFEPEIECIFGKKKFFKDLKKDIKNYSEVIFGTDHDREGEAIAYYLSQNLKLPLNLNNRALFDEISKKSINQSINNLKTINIDLVKSQQTRRMLDRMIGFKISRLLQQKIKSPSAGRVQSVILKIVCDREIEIKNFESKKYWKINLLLKLDRGTDLLLDYYNPLTKLNKVFDSNKMNQLKEFFKQNKTIKFVENNYKTKSIKSSQPLKTSTLVSLAYSKYKFSIKKTMLIAQKLYEGLKINNELKGLITYMRTDSTRINSDFIKEINSFIIKKFGTDYLKKNTDKFSAKQKKIIVQDAHEAIRPVSLKLEPNAIKEQLDEYDKDYYKIYNLIYWHTISSFCVDAIRNEYKLKFLIENEILKFNYSKYVFDGYLICLPFEYDLSQNPIIKKLSNLKINNQYPLIDAKFIDSETFPKPRFNNASIVKILEKLGIGRPSTYGTTLSRLIERGYVEMKNQSIIPTIRGEFTNKILQEYFNKILNENFTSEMELNLDNISLGKTNYKENIKLFYDVLNDLINNADNNLKKDIGIKLNRSCPKCKTGELYLIRARTQKDFIGCSNFYNNCKYIENINNFESKPIGIICNKCKKHKLVTRLNSFNKKIFIACSDFPRCRNILKLTPELKGKIKELYPDN